MKFKEKMLNLSNHGQISDSLIIDDKSTTLIIIVRTHPFFPGMSLEVKVKITKDLKSIKERKRSSYYL